MAADRAKSLVDDLADQVIDLIAQNRLSQGDRLPNEAELSKLLGAGRSSVREAMKLLSTRNIVTIRQGSGTYVSGTPGVVEDPLGFSFIEDKERLAADLIEVRLLIEPAIASMAATNASEQQVARIGELADEIERLILAGEPYAERAVEFHRLIAESTGNIVVPRLIPVITSSVPLFIDMTRAALAEESIETHRAVADAIARHDGTAAHDAMYLHLVYNRAQIRKERAGRAGGDGE